MGNTLLPQQTDGKERSRKTKKKMEGPHSPSKTGTGSIGSTYGGSEEEEEKRRRRRRRTSGPFSFLFYLLKSFIRQFMDFCEDTLL